MIAVASEYYRIKVMVVLLAPLLLSFLQRKITLPFIAHYKANKDLGTPSYPTYLAIVIKLPNAPVSISLFL